MLSTLILLKTADTPKKITTKKLFCMSFCRLDAALDLELTITRPYTGRYFAEEAQGLADATGVDFKVLQRSFTEMNSINSIFIDQVRSWTRCIALSVSFLLTQQKNNNKFCGCKLKDDDKELNVIFKGLTLLFYKLFLTIVTVIIYKMHIMIIISEIPHICEIVLFF